ncbi:hypothetical protein Tco_0786898 [Tanacetum coccineum]
MVINSPCLTDKKELAIPGQTATGKEFSNPLMAGSLPKTISAKFCNTATSKIVNLVKQIHAIVDGKAVVISESSVRNDLLFDDEDGITCLTNDDIFENLALMGVERAITTDASLVAAHDSDNIIRTQTTTMPNVDIPQGMDTGGSPRRQETMGGAPAQTRSERVLKQPNELPLLEGHTSRSGEGRMAHTFELMDIVPPTPHDSPLPGGYTPGSDEGRLKLEELMAMCTKLSKQVLDLEKENDAQAVESSIDDLDEEDASKQGRKSDKTKPITVGPSTSVVRTSTVVITDTEQKQRRLTTPPPSQPSDTRDKGKDAELAQLLHQEELAQVERRQRERAAQEEASIAALYEEYDTIQASIDADALFAARLQQEERANMGKFNHNQLKGKSYEELQRLYEREQKWINDFVPMDSEKEEKKSVEPESEGKKGKRIKRVADSALKQKSSKKQKMMQEQESAKSDEDATADYEHEKEELRMWLTVVLDEEETVDPEILSAKYPIVDWESHNLRNDDMEDLQVYKIIIILRVHTLLMDGTLTCFNMLVEKRYPLIKEMLEKMLNWKLEAEARS